jgi:hypothetical protein
MSKGRHAALVTSSIVLQGPVGVGGGDHHGGGCLAQRRPTFEASREWGTVWWARVAPMVEGVKLHHFRQAPLVMWRLVSVACVLVVLMVLRCLSVLVACVVSSLFFLNTKCARHDPEKKHKPQIGLGRSLCEEYKAETCPHEEWRCAYWTSPSSRLAL